MSDESRPRRQVDVRSVSLPLTLAASLFVACVPAAVIWGVHSEKISNLEKSAEESKTDHTKVAVIESKLDDMGKALKRIEDAVTGAK